jgi:hypothetical protein
MGRYDESRFLTTHNSYSGGPRGPLPAQLGARVRCLELDFHDNGWKDVHDYRVGHLKPGMEVAFGNGNPITLMVKDWLATVAGWSAANPGHGPITIVLDSKDDLTDNDDGGDLEDFNEILLAAFGQKLFTRDEYDQGAGAWPDVDALRDRILCVLSGNGSSRAAYRWAFGTHPAIGANADGQVVLLNPSTIGDVNCWSGKADAAAGVVRWKRKFSYGLSNLGLSEAAVAVTDGGWVVTVHRFSRPNLPDRLESRVGRIQDDPGNEGRITWFSSQIMASGISPSIQIAGDEVIEIHATSDGQGRQQVRGRLNRQSKKVEWQKARATQSPLFERDTADWQGHRIRCGADPGGWLGTAFDADALRPVRFRQVVFVELQKGEDPAAMRDALFFAADAKNEAAIAQARNQGFVARAWGFEDGDQTKPWIENMPATDTPGDPWYQMYMQGARSRVVTA